MTKWDERYRSGYGVDGTAEPVLRNAVAHLPVGKALDLASGLGRNALYLASLGWKVTALDSSQVAVDALRDAVDAHCVDLESPDFRIEPNAYDLICDCHYLQRNLFPQIRNGVKAGGLFVGVISMVDEDPTVRPMNPDYLCQPGELLGIFPDWEILHSSEGKPKGDAGRRRVAELVARKPLGLSD
jgi:tellurite methyltransferase